MFAIAEIPTNRMLAFDNSTEEDYRMFFIGCAGWRFHEQQDVSFQELDGAIHNTVRCSITLSDSPHVALVSSHALIKCQPSGWLAFEDAPTKSDCEISAFIEQNFVSFLNGKKVPFHWADRRIAPDKIRRTYFGWVKSRQNDHAEANQQPLPFMGGIEVFTYGEEVLSYIPNLFQRFAVRSQLFDFAPALHPLWTALDGVLHDRLALASISLERTASLWKSCRAEVLSDNPASNASVWKNKSLLRSLRKSLLGQLDEPLGSDAPKQRCLSRVIDGLIACLNRFIKSDPCRSLTKDEKVELREVLASRINNLTNIPNSAQLRQPFEDLQIPLSAEEDKAIQQRNIALHGGQEENTLELKSLNLSAEYFDRIRMLITKFVLKLCDYEGPYIDYASRPSAGNFEVKSFKKKTE